MLNKYLFISIFLVNSNYKFELFHNKYIKTNESYT